MICGLLPAGAVWKSSGRTDEHHESKSLGRKRAHHCYRRYVRPQKKVVCANEMRDVRSKALSARSEIGTMTCARRRESERPMAINGKV